MKMLFRLFWLIVSQAKRSRCPILGPCETELRVFPADLDLFMHVNNGVYLTYADLGRMDLMLRADVFHTIRKKGWYPVVAAETIQFKKSLRLGQRFTLKTVILGWTERSIYIEQVFLQRNEVVATAIIDGRFLAKSGGKVSIAELLALVDMQDPSPVLPEHVQQWVASMESIRA